MPNYLPPRLTALSLVATLSLSACATVDVSGYGASTETVAAIPAAEKGNVITRSVMRLYDVFVDRGWYEDTSRKRVQSAANILLNGLQTPDVKDGTVQLASAASTDVLLDDIQTARYHIVQTTKAADVYLEIASGDASLTDELKQLQKALRVSEKVTDGFASNDLAGNAAVKSDLSALQGEVDALRRVTDAFGDVVRARRIAIASQTTS